MRRSAAEIRDKIHRATSSVRKAKGKSVMVARINWKEWELVRIRSNAANKTGWTTKEVDLWATKEIELGQMIVNDKTTGERHWLMDEKEREAKWTAGGKGPKADRAAMLRKVRLHVDNKEEAGRANHSSNVSGCEGSTT